VAGRASGLQKTEWWGTGMVICLERVADLYMAQMMPVPLTVSGFSKIQIGFIFLVPAHLGSPGKGSLNGCVFTRKVAARGDAPTRTINDVATGYFSSYTEVSIVCVLWNMDIILSTVGLNFGTKNCTDLQDVTGRIVWCSRTIGGMAWYELLYQQEM